MEVYKQIRKDVCWFFFWMIVIQIVISSFGFFTDSTDGIKRSGMNLRKDYETGCEYLESTGGYLIPRVDKDYKHICR